jgi:hypothetical protein
METVPLTCQYVCPLYDYDPDKLKCKYRYEDRDEKGDPRIVCNYKSQAAKEPWQGRGKRHVTRKPVSRRNAY